MIQPEGSNRTETDPHHKWHAWPEQKFVMGLEKEEPSSSHIMQAGGGTGTLRAQGSKIQLKKTKAANRGPTALDAKKYSYTRF